jgi:PPOX class probable F420-dependent enzyme
MPKPLAQASGECMDAIWAVGQQLLANRSDSGATDRCGMIGARMRLAGNMTAEIPDDYRQLLDRPLFGSLGTIRPDNTVQVSPMWFEFDGESIRFTHTTKRAKFRNLQHNPSMSLAIMNPDRPTSYLEVRGKLIEVVPDPAGEFYVRLGKRYGNANQQAPADKADRVILVMSIEHTAKQ